MSKKKTAKKPATPTSKPDHRRAITLALVELSRAKVAAAAAIAAMFPLGSEVRYEKRGAIQTGKVLTLPDARDPSRMRVENIYTDTSYWIWLGDVCGFESAARAGWDIEHAYDRRVAGE